MDFDDDDDDEYYMFAGGGIFGIVLFFPYLVVHIVTP
jgi:hypothetical protein